MFTKDREGVSFDQKIFEQLGTFRHNKREPIHSWFGYTEGFSSKFVSAVLTTEMKKTEGLVLDPFGGSGTTGVEAVRLGFRYHGYEINPAMAIIAKAKTISSFNLSKKFDSGEISLEELSAAVSYVVKNKIGSRKYRYIFGDKPYFSDKNLKQILSIRENIDNVEDDDLKTVLLSALMSIMIEASNLKRAPDLKYKPREKFDQSPSANILFVDKCENILRDLVLLSLPKVGRASNYVLSAMEMKKTEDRSVDICITSPPYLNGTNYIKNTKLELWISGCLNSETDMKALNKTCITCSINTAQDREYPVTPWRQVNKTIRLISEKAYDPRITPMVANYFVEMSEVLKNIHRVLKKNSSAFVVIGDSAFNGVHVPTHEHLMQIARYHGFQSARNYQLRKRRSRGGLELSEDVLVLRK